MVTVPFIVTVVVILIVIGTLVFLAMRAPFIDAEWKGYIRYAAIVGTVIWLLLVLLRHFNVHL